MSVTSSSGAAPAPPSAVTPPRPPRRDWLLRLTLLAAVLGAVLTVLEGALQSSFGSYATVLGLPASAYHQVVIPLLALVALAGSLILDKQPLGGLLLLIGGTMLALPGGGYLIPAAVLGGAWAAWRHSAARIALGLVLLIPGVVAGYYGLAAAVARISGSALPGLPPSLSPPTHWGQLTIPLTMLLVAWLGAVLLMSREAPTA